MSDKINRVVLAYSGGLDTSVILKWLQQEYQCEVVTFTADLGQGEELEPARQKALNAGVRPEHISVSDKEGQWKGRRAAALATIPVPITEANQFGPKSRKEAELMPIRCRRGGPGTSRVTPSGIPCWNVWDDRPAFLA